MNKDNPLIEILGVIFSQPGPEYGCVYMGDGDGGE